MTNLMHLEMYVNTTEMKRLFVVYHILNGNDVVYVGTAPLMNATHLTDALHNSELADHIRNYPCVHMRVTFVGLELDAQMERGADVVKLKPHFNYRGYDIRTAFVIRCNETGVEYKNMAEACRMLDIAQSSMSNHMQGNTNYSKLRGLTFSKAPKRQP